jgi:membrane protease YdiL (CAAX protease family)
MKNTSFIIFLLISIFSLEAKANFHAVGWTNSILPGGGRLMMGEYAAGAKEAALEVSTFGIGYSMSPDSSLTLDGTPIDYPSIITSSYSFKKRQLVCIKYDAKTKKCLQYSNRLVNAVGTGTSSRPRDATRPLTAALLQEFGLKYHLMNSFLSYRDQFNIEGGDPGQGIDQRSVNEMFKDPFRWEVISSPWVYLPIAVSVAFAAIEYRSIISTEQPSVSRLNGPSKAYLAFDQLAVYPLGSAAPEETFFRGFVQNEFYYLVRSPYFAVPMSSLVFALAHSQDGWPGAFVSGLYQGMMAYKNDGDLSFGNAIHFWGVVALGIEAYLLTTRSASTSAAPAALQFQFTF